MDKTFNILFFLIFLPKFIFWCSVFSYEGFVNGSTLTKGGFRNGIIAKVYAVIYLTLGLFSLPLFVVYFKDLFQLDFTTIKQSLLHVEPIGVGLVTLCIAALGFLFKLIIIRKVKKSIWLNKYRHKVYNSILYFFGAMGIQNLIGAPQWVLLCIYAFFIYFGAYTSPKTVIKAMKPNVGVGFVYFKKVDNSPELTSKV